MAQLQIDLSGRGGLAPRFWGDIRGTQPDPASRILGEDNQMAAGTYNPLRRFGYLSPSNGTKTTITYESGSLAALPTSTILDVINSTVYFAEHGQKVWMTDSTVDTALELAVDLGATGTPVIMDLEIYQVNSVRKMFVVYETGGNLEIAISSLPYDSGTDNITWLSATVTGTAGLETISTEAFMEVADNGFAYLFRNNRVDKIDGTSTTGGSSGTITNNVLLFPNYFSIVDAKDYRGNMYIAIHQDQRNYRNSADNSTLQAQCGVYIWDRFSGIVQTRDYIPIDGIKAIRKLYVAPNGALRVITESSIEGIAEIREFTGSSFQVIEEISERGYNQYRDGLVTSSIGTFWIAEDNFIYFHGKTHPKDQKEGLFRIYDNGYSTSSIFGGAMNLFGGATPRLLYAHTGGDDTLFSYNFMAESSAASQQGDIYTLVKYLPQQSNVEYIDIYMFPSSGSGGNTCATIKIYFNQSNTAWASKVITFAEAARGYKRIEINKPYVNAIQIEIEYPTGVAADTTNFFPSLAVVNYQPTETKG